MDIETIFDFDIDRINEEKLKNIRIMPGSINFENYSKLSETLKNSPNLENIFINCKDGKEEFWNNFFKIFRSDDGKFCVDPQKIILSGDLEKYNCDFFKDAKRLALLPIDIGTISNIERLFPNLESIQLFSEVGTAAIGDNLINLINFAKYTKSIELTENIGIKSVRSFISKCNLEEKLFLSDDGLCLINKDRLEDDSIYPQNLRINLRDIEKIGVENIKKSKDKVILVAENVAELPVQKISEYEALGIDISGVVITSKENNKQQNEPYDIQTYSLIREKIEELVEDINPTSTEKEKFAEVYKRVCENIVYDTPAAYPKNKDEEEYERKQVANCRNLKNGLLEGKCVCAGYADILRNALSLVGVEAKYISGPVIEKEIEKKHYKPEKLKVGYVYKEDDEKVIIAENHAWNKVKLDGVWYNVDATWDAPKIRAGKLPKYCLKSDEHIKKEDKKDDPKGPVCENNISDEEIRNLFDSEAIYIGNFRIPTVKDIVKKTKRIEKDTKKSINNFKNKILNSIKKKDTLKIGTSEDDIKFDKTEENLQNQWRIENWGISRNEFAENSKEIISNIDAQNKENELKEQDDFLK